MKARNWIKKEFDNTEAQAAVIYMYIVGLVMGIAVYIYTSPIMDAFSVFHNSTSQVPSPIYPISQNLQDSQFLTQLAFHDWIIIYIIVLTLAAYVAALESRNQVV